MKNQVVVITDSAQFQEVINSLEESFKKIQDLFGNQRKNAEEINETDTWTGATAQAVYAKYIKLSENFGPILYSLDLYIKFLKKTLEDYTLAEKEINMNVDAVAQALDVIS